jgi:hypothetical protein
MTAHENSICSTGAPEEVWDRLAEVLTEEMGGAYRGVKCITGEDSKLIFADAGLAEKAKAVMGGNPLDWLGFAPYKDEVVIEMKNDPFFGEGKTYTRFLPSNTNLFMLLKSVDEGIETTGDYHHTFFEGFEITGETRMGFMVLRPIMGS